jgi:tetraacyldisaccharide 4'-kinase
VLGGAGKTPVAIALARAIAAGGERVALIGHAYRGSLRAPRVVGLDDRVDDVGDDALVAARLLAPDGIPVVVAPSRAGSLEHAARAGATILVVDGLLQAAPVPVTDAVLVLDGEEPWGGGACPPIGDLRAPPRILLEAADHLAVLGRAGGDHHRGPEFHAEQRSGPLATFERSLGGIDGCGDRGALLRRAVVVESGVEGAADAWGERWTLAALARQRVGVLLAIARPHRIERVLAAAGILPTASLRLGDHALFTRRDLERAARSPVDVWLTTARCAVKLPARVGGAPVLALEHRVDVRALVSRLAAAGPPGGQAFRAERADPVVGSRACDSDE